MHAEGLGRTPETPDAGVAGCAQQLLSAGRLPELMAALQLIQTEAARAAGPNIFHAPGGPTPPVATPAEPSNEQDSRRARARTDTQTGPPMAGGALAVAIAPIATTVKEEGPPASASSGAGLGPVLVDLTAFDGKAMAVDADIPWVAAPAWRIFWRASALAFSHGRVPGGGVGAREFPLGGRACLCSSFVSRGHWHLCDDAFVWRCR